MQKPLFDIDQKGLEVEVNSYKPGKGMAWAQLFPLKYTFDFDIKGIEGNDGLPVTADRVAFNSKAPKKTRKKVGTWKATLGKIAVSRDKDEMDIENYQTDVARAAAFPNDKAAARELVNLVYDDVRYVSKAIDARTEVEALIVGSLGKRVFSTKYDGDMAESEEINFNVPEENFIGATTKWSTTGTADGLADIKRGVTLIKKKGLPIPRYAIMSQTMFDYLCSQTKVIKKIASAILQATGMESTDDVTLESINAYQRKHGQPQILVLDSYVNIEDKDGKQHAEQPWNESSVVLSPEPRLGYTYWKPVTPAENTAALQTQGAYYLVTRYSELNPKLEITMAEAYIQPGLTNRRSLVFLNALNTTWNEGEE